MVGYASLTHPTKLAIKDRGIREMTDAAHPTDDEIDAAARVLFEEGSFHHWWPTFKKSYDEFVATDQIGKEEFDGIVERVLFAAAKARLSRTP